MSNRIEPIITDGKSITLIATTDDLILEAERDDVIVKSRMDVNLKSEINNINLNAKHCIDIVSDEKSVNLKSSHGKINLNADNSIRMRSTNGGVMVKSDRGTLDIESYQDMDVLAEQGDITIEAPNGTVNIKALRNINITPGNSGSVFINGGLHATTLSQGASIGGSGLLMPPGSVIPYCGSSSPTGWFICDGSSYDPVTYNVLFNVIGYRFGGNVGGNFNVPDMRGRVPLGISTGLEEFFANKDIGDTGGSETHTLTIPEMPRHNHTAYADNTTGIDNVLRTAGGGLTVDVDSQGGVNEISTSETGGGAPHSIMQPYMALNFIIKY